MEKGNVQHIIYLKVLEIPVNYVKHTVKPHKLSLKCYENIRIRYFQNRVGPWFTSIRVYTDLNILHFWEFPSNFFYPPPQILENSVLHSSYQERSLYWACIHGNATFGYTLYMLILYTRHVQRVDRDVLCAVVALDLLVHLF